MSVLDSYSKPSFGIGLPPGRGCGSLAPLTLVLIFTEGPLPKVQACSSPVFPVTRQVCPTQRWQAAGGRRIIITIPAPKRCPANNCFSKIRVFVSASASICILSLDGKRGMRFMDVPQILKIGASEEDFSSHITVMEQL